jgi:hypothetical protein
VTVLRDLSAAEARRLHAVARTGLLDVPPPAGVDRAAQLARHLFDVPIARVTLVGPDVQRFLPADGAPAVDVPLSDAFCTTVVEQDAQLVVPDLAADPRFAGGPHVAGPPGLRFYAGEPLRDAEGTVLGTLCLMDHRPRWLSERERAAFAALGRWAEGELTRSAELDRAAEVHRGLLPAPGGLSLPGYRVAAACVPARTVGGDLVDHHVAPDGRLLLTLGDVMGRGVGAAILMASVRAAVRTAGRLHPPAEAVRAVAAALEQDLERTGALVTLFQARLDPRTGECAVTDAGHGLRLLVRDGRALRGDLPAGLPLGTVAGDTWPEGRIRVRPGDALLAFSDGLAELHGGVAPAVEHLRRLAVEHPDPRELVRRATEPARRRTGTDDVTVLALRAS